MLESHITPSWCVGSVETCVFGHAVRSIARVSSIQPTRVPFAWPVSKLVRLLEIGLIIDVERFPAFRTAFEPAEINWDIDPELFKLTKEKAEQGMRFCWFGGHTIWYVSGIVVLYFLWLSTPPMLVGAITHGYVREQRPERAR